jgi:hypothetical protein
MFGRDLGHHLAAGLELPPPVEGQGECEGAAEVIGVRWAERRLVWHGRSLSRPLEQRKNFGIRNRASPMGVTAHRLGL